MNSMASITKQGSQTPLLSVVVGDRNTKAFTFVVKRFDGRSDLAELVWMLQVKNPEGRTDATALYAYRTDEEIQLTWTVGGYATDAEGKTELQVCGFDSENTMQWCSGMYYLEVQRRIAPDREQREAVSQLRSLIDTAAKDVVAVTQRVNETAEAVRNSIASAEAIEGVVQMLNDGVKTADEHADEAERFAGEAAGHAGRAEMFATLAEQDAATHGFFYTYIGNDGHLHYVRSDGMSDLNLRIENGRLIGNYGVA
ncbi:MAG: hypothetical protein J6K73_05355 [Clostridia bacterium]|nr:hypothetical protein [Clostridia bacterium]